MPKYTDRDGDDLAEAEALSLDVGVSFIVSWEADGQSLECVRLPSAGTWEVGHRTGGHFDRYGTVVHEGHLFRAVQVAHTKPQETFSAAARKYL